MAVESAVVGFKQAVEGVDAAGNVVKQDILLALEAVVAVHDLLDGAGEALQGERGLVLGGDEAGRVAVGQQIKKSEQQQGDDELGAPGNEDALKQQASQLGALLQQKEEQGDDTARAAGNGSFEVAAARLRARR